MKFFSKNETNVCKRACIRLMFKTQLQIKLPVSLFLVDRLKVFQNKRRQKLFDDSIEDSLIELQSMKRVNEATTRRGVSRARERRVSYFSSTNT